MFFKLIMPVVFFLPGIGIREIKLFKETPKKMLGTK